MTRQVPCLPSPFDVRIPPDGGQTRARCVDQDPVERLVEGQRSLAIDVHHVRMVRAGVSQRGPQEPQAARLGRFSQASACFAPEFGSWQTSQFRAPEGRLTFEKSVLP